MNATFTVNDSGIQSLLSRLSHSMSDMQPAMNDIGMALLMRIEEGFQQGVSPWGQKWAPLSQATILQRLGSNKANFSKKTGKISAKGKTAAMAGFQILVSSGILRNSITHQSDAHSATVGTNVKYAATQQFGAWKGAFGRTRHGAPIPWGNIPARPFFPIQNRQVNLPSSWAAQVQEILLRHLQQDRV